MVNSSLESIQRELEDIKALLILQLQSAKFGNEDIAKAIGVSPGIISQLIDKQKYPIK